MTIKYEVRWQIRLDVIKHKFPCKGHMKFQVKVFAKSLVFEIAHLAFKKIILIRNNLQE